MKPMMMKTETRTQKRNWRESLSLGVALIAMMITFAGCGKNGGGGSSPAPAPVIIPPIVGTGTGVCSGCPSGTGTFLTSAAGKVMGGQELEIDAEFFGTTAVTSAQPNTYIMNPSYYGPFAGQGTLYIGTTLPYCNIPAGVYTLRTMQPGTWGNDGAGRSLEGIFLEATSGPVQIQVYLNGWIVPAVSPAIGRDGRQYPNSLGGIIQVKLSSSPASLFCERGF